jgi:hypothetical protein
MMRQCSTLSGRPAIERSQSAGSAQTATREAASYSHDVLTMQMCFIISISASTLTHEAERSHG